MRPLSELFKVPKRGNRFYALLVVLFGMVIAGPFESHTLPLYEILLITVLLSAVYAVGTTPRRRVVALVLVVAAQVAFYVQGSGSIPSAVLHGLFLIYCTQQLLGFVLASGRVSTDKLLAALCVYMLMAFIFMIGYLTACDIDPGCLRGLDTTPGSPSIPVQTMYFSFVTQTTLGYGDVAPSTSEVGRHVRTLAILQATIGQLYLTVLVARLVALHIAHRPLDLESDDR